jgi:hypothetical protein
MKPDERFTEEAARRPRGLVREFAHFLMQNKKWWLAGILGALLLLALILVLGGTAAGPFIYTLF